MNNSVTHKLLDIGWCIKTTLSVVFSGGIWQTEWGGGEKTGGGVLEKKKTDGGGEKKTCGGGEKKTGRRRRSPMLLEVQSDLVIHWLFKALIAFASCIYI